MQINVKAQFDDVKKVLEKRGLEEKGRVQKFIDNEVIRFCAPYTPKDSGLLLGAPKSLGGKIVYNSPYAKYMYYGKVMVSPSTGSPWARRGERKSLTSRGIKYSGAPQRGAYWFERMKADHAADIAREAAEMAGGRT